MAEPVWALVVAALGLVDMDMNYCPTGCLARREQVPAFAVSAGSVVYLNETAGEEVYVRRDTARAFGPFGLSYGLSVTSHGAVWVGAGIVHRIDISGTRAFLESHFMPGVYLRGNGADLGGPINARAGVEIGWETESGVRLGLSVDHRSNGGIFERNPGMETVQVRLSFPTR